MKTPHLAYPLLIVSNLYLHFKVFIHDASIATISESLPKKVMKMDFSETTEEGFDQYSQQHTKKEELHGENVKLEAEKEKDFEQDEQRQHEEEESGVKRYDAAVRSLSDERRAKSLSEKKVADNMVSTERKRNTKFGFSLGGSSADESSFLPARSSGDNDHSDTSLPSQYPVVSVQPSSEFASESQNIPTDSLSTSFSTPFVPSSRSNVDSSTVTDKAPIETEDLSTRRNSLPRNNTNNNNFILQSLEQIVASIMVSLFGGLPFENPVETVTEILPDTDELDLPNVETVTEILPDTDVLELPDIGSNNNPIVQGLEKIITSIMDSLFGDCENEIDPSSSPSHQSSTSDDIDSSSDNAGSDIFIDDFFLDDDDDDSSSAVNFNETEIEYLMSRDEELERQAMEYLAQNGPPLDTSLGTLSNSDFSKTILVGETCDCVYGSETFDDEHEPWLYGKITQIELNHFISAIRYIGIVYANGTSFSHGKKYSRGNNHVIDLDENQHIVKVSGQASPAFIRQLALETNDGLIYGPFGDTGDYSFSFDFGEEALLYIFGRANSTYSLHALGFASISLSTTPNPATPHPTISDEPSISIQPSISPSVSFQSYIIRTAPVGGTGGSAFDHIKAPWQYNKIKQIILYWDSFLPYIRYIGIKYENDELFEQGIKDGNKYEYIDLNTDQYILGVRGRYTDVDERSNDSISQITFITNDGNHGPYGKPVGEEFDFDFQGDYLMYIFGRSGQWINQLGFAHRPIVISSSPSISTSPSQSDGVIRTEAVGITWGSPFDDQHLLWEYGQIVQIELFASSHYVDFIGITYEDGKKYEHGGKYGNQHYITLDENQYITKVSGQSHYRLVQLKLERNDGEIFGPYGFSGDDDYFYAYASFQSFEFDFEGNMLVYIFGRETNDSIHQLGFAHVAQGSSTPSSLPSSMPSSFILEPIAQVDFSQGNNCPTCAPYSLHNGAQIKTAPGGTQALRIDSDGPYAKIPGIDISPSKMPECTLTVGLYLESIPEGAYGWIFGQEEGNYDRTIVLHDPRDSIPGKNVITAATGKVPWMPWYSYHLEKFGKAPSKQWFHVTAVFRQGGDCFVYVNGVKSDFETIGNNTEGLPDLYIGRPLLSENHWADAWIKEVRVFAVALTDTQVQYESDSFFGITRTEPVGGDGGTPFDDWHVPWEYGMIKEIEIYSNSSSVNYINITYANGQSFPHGKQEGNRDIINLDEHEYIVEVSGRSDDVAVLEISFKTNNNVIHGPYGNSTDEGEPFHFDFNGDALLHIFGMTISDEEEILQLGFAYIHSSLLPSSMPSLYPSSFPSMIPSVQPSTQHSTIPSISLIPSLYPSSQPSVQPSKQPSTKPSISPSLMPSLIPSLYPSSFPSVQPSVQPSTQPSSTPSTSPSSRPSLMPSLYPSSFPSMTPSVQPSTQPSSIPSESPSLMPSLTPSLIPSSQPSMTPSLQPSNQPSSIPSESPSLIQSLMPSLYPSSQPSNQPSGIQTQLPSSTPSFMPSLYPSSFPSMSPSVQPSTQPSSKPSESPSLSPSLMPSLYPSLFPSMSPSVQPSIQPSITPSESPSSLPSLMPSLYPSSFPSIVPSVQPSTQPSSKPSISPSSMPTLKPSLYPSKFPSNQPSKIPSVFPSIFSSDQPSIVQSLIPSVYPSKFPSNQPSKIPSVFPSIFSSDQPSIVQSLIPSVYPSKFPSNQPSKSPTVYPSLIPSDKPSSFPSRTPSMFPSVFPSDQPTSFPSKTPSVSPSIFPSIQPSTVPSKTPSLIPSVSPSENPSSIPSTTPSISPSIALSDFPSFYPTQPYDDDYSITDNTSEKPEIPIDTTEMETYPFETTCILIRTEVLLCEDDPTFSCSTFASQGWCTENDYKEIMTERCKKSCDTCPPPVISDFPYEKKQTNSNNIMTNFNLDLSINTDANSFETSWLFLSDNNKDIILDSNEIDTAPQLSANTLHKLKYSCTVSHIEAKEMDPDTIEPFCYNLEVHDSFGDGPCCDNGPGYFSMSVNNTKNETLDISNPFYEGNKIEISFCINDQGNIESDTDSMDVSADQPSYYPMKTIQCKNRKTCICDSKPNIFTDVEKSDVLYEIKSQTLLGVTMLSQSNKVQDVESPQYKAACWVLFDDPYIYVSTGPKEGTQQRMLQQYRTETDTYVEEGAQKRMMQRYALAVLYFSTTPKKWVKQYKFLSRRSECEWNKSSNKDGFFSIQGSVCDDNDNIISVYLKNNNLDGTIIEELSELKMLGTLDLSKNNIQGSIPPVLGQLAQLRSLYLSQNQLEGSIHPNIFDAKKLETIELFANKISETIPDTIINLRQLSSLNLNENEISGSIPDAMYSLRNLQTLNLGSNKFSSSISPEIGNLKKLKTLNMGGNILNGEIPSTVGELTELHEMNLRKNTFSGSIPSSIGELSSLSELSLDENQLTGEIPESLFSLSSLRNLTLQKNAVSGSIPDKLCEIDNLDFQADCKNDIFEPQVSCSCCTVCNDETPTWDGKCPDATMKIEIVRSPIDYDGYSYTSGGLEWSITNNATQMKIPLSPLSPEDGDLGGTVCVAYSDCISIDMISPPIFNTVYRIYWNNVSVDDGILMFPGSLQQENTPKYKNEPFQFDRESQELVSCRDIELTCDDGNGTFEKVSIERNSAMISSVSKVLSMFGSQNTQDPSSDLSKALCWLVKNKSDSNGNRRLSETVENHDSHNNRGLSDTEILQRYVLTILHFSSTYDLFGEDEYPPSSHECDWPGIQCTMINGTNIVTGISLSSGDGQIINGTLIDELGGLQFLETLEMNQTQIRGTIPESFSNLWSLKKLDFSENELTGTLPVNMFHQLNKLEDINLSNNFLSSNINEDIGSFSHIRVLSIRNNSLTGSLPLEGFKFNDLEYLDVSGNELNSVEFDHLIKHTNLKTLDLSFNFFVGSLHEDTFTSLTELEYLNISQNDFSGIIPSTFPELYNITHFDMHANRFKGVIPVGLTDLSYIQYINLQGNKLTGSLPSQINQLSNLEVLVLSHNEIKGDIPFDPNTLKNLDKLHLHGNSLKGEAPLFNNLTSYITDCGYPAAAKKPIACLTCNKCCNSDGNCQEKTSKDFSQVQLTMMFICSIIGFVSICYMMKYYITHSKYFEKYFNETVGLWNALMLISDKSVYHFLLARNRLEWLIAVACIVFQSATLFLFVHSADIANETSDREYTMLCPANSLECEDSIKISNYGYFVFGLILTIWLLKDIVGSVKLMLLSFHQRNIDFFFAGAVVFTVTMLSLWSSIIYIIAIAVKNTDLIKDAVVLLFVIEIDERLYELVENINPEWVDDIERDMREGFVYVGNDLMIATFLTVVSGSLKRVRRKIRKSIRKVIRKMSRRRRREREIYLPISPEVATAGAEISDSGPSLVKE